jgi:hypothetical protein
LNQANGYWAETIPLNDKAFKAPLLLCLSNSKPNSEPKKNIISKTIDAKSGLRIAVAHPGTEL